MSATVHDFDQQLARGKAAEQRLDRYFAAWFAIQAALLHEDKQGIDRWFERAAGKQKGERLPIQYKTDFRAAETGNALIELSHEPEGGGYRPGWARRRRDGRIVYYCPADSSAERGTAYVLAAPSIPDHCSQWEAAGHRWVTTGLLLPLEELRRASEKVLEVA